MPLVDIDPGREIPGGVGLDRLDAPYRDRIASVFEDAWARSPLPTILRWAERSQARPFGDTPLADDPFLSDMLPHIGRGDPAPARSPLRSPDELNARYGDLGLSFEAPEREAVADMLADLRREELARQRVLARDSRAGFWTEAVYFGAGLLATAADPINVASAFVPIVGPTRFAQWAARTGVTTARAGRGVAEGVAGAALVEPIVLAGAEAESADYGTVDSLMNLAFGGILGGGLHVAGGKLVDLAGGRGRAMREKLAAAAPETREAVVRTAVAQTATGRKVDVEPVLDADPRAAAAAAEAEARIEAEQAQQRRLQAERDAAAEIRRAGRQGAEEAERERIEALAREPVAEVLAEQRLAVERMHNVLRAEGYGATRDLPVPAEFKPSADDLQLARDLIRGGPPEPGRGDPRRIVGLAEFVRREGGIDAEDPDAGWLATQDVGGGILRKRRPKSKGGGRVGRSMDAMLRVAQDERYLGEDATISDLIEALTDDIREPGSRRNIGDEGRVDERQEAFDVWDEYLDRGLGLTIREMEPRELAWLLSLDPDRRQLHALMEPGRRLDEAEALERDILIARYVEERVQAEMAELAGRPLSASAPGETVPALARARADQPEDIYGGRPATLDDIERLYADLERSTGQSTADRPGPEGPGLDPARTGDAAPRQAAAPGPGARGDPAGEGAAADPVEFAERQDAPDADALADPEAAAAADELAARGDLTDEQIEELADLELEQLDMTDAEAAEVAALDGLVADSDEFAKAVEALALCRKG